MKSKSSVKIISVGFKLKCLTDIEAAISLPAKGFFVRNATSMRLCYNVSSKIKYIHLTTPEMAAKFLRKHGIIDSYAMVDGQVKMYSKSLITIAGHKGQPVQMERLVPVAWNDIHLNAPQVQTFCAVHEFELAGKTMGAVKGKVVSMINNYLKTA